MKKGPSVRVFDPRQVFQDYVHGKKIIYLDNMIWIELADRADELSKRAYEACLHARELKLAIFPLSCSSIDELFDQPNPEKRLIQGRIMDSLSEGVTFRAMKHIYDIEIGSALEFMETGKTVEPDHSLLYSHVGDYLEDSYFQFPTFYTDEDIASFLSFIRPKLSCVEFFLTTCNIEEFQANHKAALLEYKEVMEETPRTPLNMESALLEERLYCFNNIARPLLRDSLLRRYNLSVPRMLEFLDEFANRNGKGGSRTLAEFLSKMPSLDLFAKIMAARVIDKTRKVSRNDYYDTEHAKYAIYTDYFFTEKNLAHILNNICKLPSVRPSLTIRRGLENLLAVCDGLIQGQLKPKI